jgi:hypothetical protein
MPERAKLLASAFFAGTLAVAATLGPNTIASAADCLENPDQRITQPGHWYYHSDRAQNRKCWYFEAAVAPAGALAPAAPATTANDDSQQSLLSRVQAGLSQAFSPPPQQPQQVTIPDASSEAPQTISKPPRKHASTARQERPQIERPVIEPPPTTTGVAASERLDQPQRPAAEKPAAQKNEKRDPPIDVADREALFQDFMKWQLDRNVFGRP